MSSNWNTTSIVLSLGAGALGGIALYCLLQRAQKKRYGRQQHMKQLPVQHSYTKYSDLVIPAQTAKNGMLYAGEFLSLMDLVGGTTAFKHCQGPIVTVSIDSVRFLVPAFAHDVLVLSGRVNAAFGSSLEVEVVVEVVNIIEGKRNVCCTGRLVFVALDYDKRPRKIPSLLLETEEEKSRAQAALLRKQERANERINSISENGHEWWKTVWPKEEEALNNMIKKDGTEIEMINASQCETELCKIIMPQHANPLGIVFGGTVMAWMEQAAGMSATILTRGPVLTAGLDRMSFQKSSKVGSLISCKACVTRVFDKSLEVLVRVSSFSGESREAVLCNTGYFTFALMDSGGEHSVQVGKQVLPKTDEEKREYCEALRRRESRVKDIPIEQ